MSVRISFYDVVFEMWPGNADEPVNKAGTERLQLFLKRENLMFGRLKEAWPRSMILVSGIFS